MTCSADIHVDELQAALSCHGQCLPVPSSKEFGLDLAGLPDTVKALLDRNLPHGLEAELGSWRDWVLGMTVRLPDGTVAKCGSRVVKNVAGYDVMKLFLGARGELGTILSATLRTYPIESIPPCRAWARDAADHQAANWIQRVLRTDFEAARASLGECLQAYDPGTSTLWARLPLAPMNGGERGQRVRGEAPQRYANDWAIHNDTPLPDPLADRLRARAIAIFGTRG